MSSRTATRRRPSPWPPTWSSPSTPSSSTTATRASATWPTPSSSARPGRPRSRPYPATSTRSELAAGGGAVQDRGGLDVGELGLELVAGFVGQGGVVELGEARAGVGGALQGVGGLHQQGEGLAAVLVGRAVALEDVLELDDLDRQGLVGRGDDEGAVHPAVDLLLLADEADRAGAQRAGAGEDREEGLAVDRAGVEDHALVGRRVDELAEG